jgi:purine-binding chemotaxis protein CheW
MSDDTKPRRPAPRLPSSGLADEILDQLKRGELSKEPVESAPETTPPEMGGPARIYTFTDSLQIGDEEEEEREVYETWVEFRLAGASFALPVAQVREILRLRDVTPVPQPPFPVIGVFNLRGRVVPLLDLRARLALPTQPPDADSRIVLVESQERRLGLLVDSVERVAQLAQSAMVRPEAETEPGEVRGLHAAEDGKIRLLDLNAILTLPERDDGPADKGEGPPAGD